MAGYRIPDLPVLTPETLAPADRMLLFDESEGLTKSLPVGPAMSGVVSPIGPPGYVFTSNGVTGEWRTSGALSVTAQRKEIIASEGQMNFATSAPYVVDYLGVYLNGVRLGNNDFTANDGYNVVIAAPCKANDVVLLEGFLGSDTGSGDDFLRADLIETTGAGLVGFDPALIYPINTVGNALATGYVKKPGDTMTGKLTVRNFGPLLSLESTSPRGAGDTFMEWRDPSGRKGVLGYGGFTGDNFLIDNEMNTPMVFSTNAVEAMRIDQVGKVGIGTTSSSARLQVTDVVGPQLRLETTTPRGGGQCSVGFNDPAGQKGFVGYAGTDTLSVANQLNNDISFQTAGQIRMTIGATGVVGVGVTPIAGTTSQIQVKNDLTLFNGGSFMGNLTYDGVANFKFCAAGYGQLISLANNTGNLSIWNTAAAGAAGAIATIINRFQINPDGFISLYANPATTFVPNVVTAIFNGTAAFGSGNAGAGISFSGQYNAAGGVADLAFISGIKENLTDGNYNGALIFGTRPTGSGGGNFERMRITSVGNVGIGTSSPQGRLHAVGPDNGYPICSAGVTKGVRIGHTPTGSSIEGVDNTLLATYQPLSIGGSTLSFSTNGVARVNIDINGNTAFSGAITSPNITGGVIFASSSGFGKVELNPGGVNNSGYVRFNLPTGASAGYMGFAANNAGSNIVYTNENSGGHQFSGQVFFQSNNMPTGNNTIFSGQGGNAWSNVVSFLFSNVSDERDKNWRGDVNSLELSAAKRIVNELGFFQWKEGPNNDKLQFGLRAQSLARILMEEGVEKTHNLDFDQKGFVPDEERPAFKYGMIEFTSWEDQYISSEMGAEEPYKLSNPAGNQFAVNYDQLSLFLISAQAKQIEALEARLVALEDLT